jgi:hypothetical protein
MDDNTISSFSTDIRHKQYDQSTRRIVLLSNKFDAGSTALIDLTLIP